MQEVLILPAVPLLGRAALMLHTHLQSLGTTPSGMEWAYPPECKCPRCRLSAMLNPPLHGRASSPSKWRPCHSLAL